MAKSDSGEIIEIAAWLVGAFLLAKLLPSIMGSLSTAFSGLTGNANYGAMDNATGLQFLYPSGVPTLTSSGAELPAGTAGPSLPVSNLRYGPATVIDPVAGYYSALSEFN